MACERLSGGRGKKYARFVIAALSSIPWIGGVISAAASLSAEKDQEKTALRERLLGLQNSRRSYVPQQVEKSGDFQADRPLGG